MNTKRRIEKLEEQALGGGPANNRLSFEVVVYRTEEERERLLEAARKNNPKTIIVVPAFADHSYEDEDEDRKLHGEFSSGPI